MYIRWPPLIVHRFQFTSLPPFSLPLLLSLSLSVERLSTRSRPISALCLPLSLFLDDAFILAAPILDTIVELLLVLALASRQIEEGRFKMSPWGDLGVVHGLVLVGRVKAVMEGVKRIERMVFDRILVCFNKTKRSLFRLHLHMSLPSPAISCRWATAMRRSTLALYPDQSMNQNSVRDVRHKRTAAWFF